MLNETREVRKTMRHLRDIHGVQVATKTKIRWSFCSVLLTLLIAANARFDLLNSSLPASQCWQMA